MGLMDRIGKIFGGNMTNKNLLRHCGQTSANGRRLPGGEFPPGNQIIQWFATPILCDERKQSMFDFVPLACPRRKMTNRNIQPHEVCQFLQFRFPQPPFVTVAAARIRRNQQSCCIGKTITSHPSPPASNTIRSKLSPPHDQY